MTPFWIFGPSVSYVTETHILVPDRNIVSKKCMWRYLLGQAHMLVKGICCSVPSDGVSQFVRNYILSGVLTTSGTRKHRQTTPRTLRMGARVGRIDRPKLLRRLPQQPSSLVPSADHENGDKVVDRRRTTEGGGAEGITKEIKPE